MNSNHHPLPPIPIGFNARLFPNNWRPALNEIEFAQKNSFQAIQFPGPVEGLGEKRLGHSLEVVAESLAAAGLTAVMEIVVHLNDDGRTATGETPLDVLQANLPAITALSCRCVHWHLVSVGTMKEEPIRRLEEMHLSQFTQAVVLAQVHGFRFGFEHNEPGLMLFSTPQSCQALLDAVPGLHFVWDFNHTTPQALPDILALIPRMSMLHISDTPLPEVNHHLPLGMGSIAFKEYIGHLLQNNFRGPAILEIGGLPKSGGFGRDTDSALIHSRQLLEQSFV